MDRLIYGVNDIKKLNCVDVGSENSENKIYEINDFSLNSTNTNLIINNQDEDKFYILDTTGDKNNFNLIDSFTLSSSFTQAFTQKDECIFCSFEGQFIKYNFADKKIKAEKHIKNYISQELKLNNNINNFMTNPPFINQCIFNPIRNEIYFGLLNGYIISLKNNLKTKFTKFAHTLMIRDIRLNNFNENIIISLGKEKIIKLLNLDQEGEIKVCIDLNEFKNEDPFLVESDKHGNIFYIDAIAKEDGLKVIKFKN